MRTIIIFDTVGEEPITFFVVDGDYAHLDRVYINTTQVNFGTTDLNLNTGVDKIRAERELYSLIYDENGNIRNEVVQFSHFPVGAVDATTPVIVAGFYP